MYRRSLHLFALKSIGKNRNSKFKIYTMNISGPNLTFKDGALFLNIFVRPLFFSLGKPVSQSFAGLWHKIIS